MLNRLTIESSPLTVGTFNPAGAKPRLRGFTLIELLLVISILSILMGFLFASLKAVRRYSREVSTRTELAHLEAAFRQFYDHYGYWPVDNDVGVNQYVPINEEMIQALSGVKSPTLSGVTDNDPNPDRIPFFEIVRKNSDNQAINAWGESLGGLYYVQFDLSGENTIELNIDGYSETLILHRPVVVWTYHPDRSSETDINKRILGSWQQ